MKLITINELVKFKIMISPRVFKNDVNTLNGIEQLTEPKNSTILKLCSSYYIDPENYIYLNNIDILDIHKAITILNLK